MIELVFDSLPDTALRRHPQQPLSPDSPTVSGGSSVTDRNPLPVVTKGGEPDHRVGRHNPPAPSLRLSARRAA
jgi:hypothetical protein